METSNPTMNASIYRDAGYSAEISDRMSISGTALKTGILAIIMVTAAVYSWSQASYGSSSGHYLLMAGGAVGGLIVALVTCFVPRISPITAPIYALLEGLFLGGLSSIFERSYPGIAIQGVGLSFGVLSMMLFLYGTGIVRATEKFKLGVFAATGAICLVYLATMIAGLFGASIPYIHNAGPIGIGFSIFVVVIAALNLIIDFDFIEQGVRHRAPRYMEWYGGFSLMVSLVWMYLEILRLLSKIRDAGD